MIRGQNTHSVLLAPTNLLLCYECATHILCHSYHRGISVAHSATQVHWEFRREPGRRFRPLALLISVDFAHRVLGGPIDFLAGLHLCFHQQY